MQKKILTVLILIAVVCSFFVKLEVTSAKKASLEEPGIGDVIELATLDPDNIYDRISYIVSNLPNKYRENDNLSFLDGLKNGVFVVAGYVRDVIIGTICDYLSGFTNHNIIIKLIWMFWGLVYAPIKNIIFNFIGTISAIFQLLFQKASIFYYIGYIISILCSFGVISYTGSIDE